MMIAGILDPYRYDFFTNGILVATIAGALCGLLGVFVVLRGLSYIGHGLSHSVFGGDDSFIRVGSCVAQQVWPSEEEH